MLAELLEKIRETIAQELEVPVESLSDRASLRDRGLDSVAAVSIIFRLENNLGLEIDIKKLAGIDTIEQLKDFLVKELTEKGDSCLKEHG